MNPAKRGNIMNANNRNIWNEINEFATEIHDGMFHKKDIFRSEFNKLEDYKKELVEMRDFHNETSVDDELDRINELQGRMQEYGIRG